MGFNTDGFVLRPARTASANAVTTGEATNGVSRDHRLLPGSYDFTTDLAEVSADQYRTAILQDTDNQGEEYLVWAANTSSLTLLETTDWTITGDPSTVTIPSGSLDVDDTTIAPDQQHDGTSRLLVADASGRSLAEVRLVVVTRGDTGAWVSAGPDVGGVYDFTSQDADAGVVVLPPQALTDLGGGVSKSRGDSIFGVRYIVAASRFWWTKNDQYVTRFAWNGKTNRWEPLKGVRPKDLGVLIEGTAYDLFPRPTRFSVGDNLPGNPANSDEYALVRVGLRPDSVALVPQVEVVPDADVEDTYPFSGPTPDAVVGVTNGILQFNPDFIDQYAGQTIWYNAEQFPPKSDGAIGDLLGAAIAPLHLSPIPGPTDRPFIRLGFRRYLTPIGMDTDSDLAALTVNEGEVGWSRTTGKIKLSSTDADKADPDAAGFNLQYLGNKVYYDGVSLTSQSLRTRQPVQLVDDSGNPATVQAANQLFIPDAVPLSGTDPLGLGTSGVLHLPDGTGRVPDNAITPETRPNDSGLIRQVEGIGDNILFTVGGAIEDLRVVELESELPVFPFLIRKGRAFVAKEMGAAGSRVALGLKDRARWGGESMYFLQADVQPAVYAEEARIYSRKRGPFTLLGTETLYFAIDGTTYTWAASALGAGTFPAATVAASISAVISGTGQAYAQQDRVVIAAGNLDTGSVEIGFGPGPAVTDRDFSGAAALGFLPGWRVSSPSTTTCWLPDTGSSLGVFRSPQNKDRSKSTPDLRDRDTFSGEVFAESVIANPAFPITSPPLQDVPGYDVDKFFLTVDGYNFHLLQNYTDVLYDFANDRFFWLAEGSSKGLVENTTAALTLRPGAVGNTFYPAVGTGYGLYVAPDGRSFSLQTYGVDFLLPADGTQGQAILVESVGNLITEGAAGSFAVGTTTFTDANATFLTDGVTPGFRLHILSGDAAGSYIVASVTGETVLDVEVDVPFTGNAGPLYGEPYISWKLHRGYPTTVYDPAVVADVQYTQFNHLAQETFKIRLLDNLGPTPDSPSQPTNRLVAVVTEAFQRGRTIRIRFGLLYGNDEAVPFPLSRGNVLGPVANDSLTVPNVGDPHFTNATFSIRVGGSSYTIGTNLTGVAVFTNPLLGDQVEYGLPSSAIAGQLKFGEDTLSNLEDAVVVYDQEFLPSAILPAGEAEYDPNTGEINLSDPDMANHVGENAYFVEQLITEDRLDAAISPLLGSFYINRPLRAGQIVEAEYYQADTQGNQIGDVIVEFLPIILRQEVATRVSDFAYTVNPTGKTIDSRVEPLIWKDSYLQNFGNLVTATFVDGTITFTEAVDAAATVQVNYGVYEAFGGEQAYSSSTIPVWRPPFFLLKDQDTFTLENDRTGEMVPGKLMRLGEVPLYIKASSYDSGTNLTTVTVWPTPQNEVGSRAPGNDVLTLLTDVPVTDQVDGIPTGGSPGYLMTFAVTYEPVDKGMLSILFHGNVTRFAVAGHLLEIGGYPFLIVSSTLASDGMTTKVDVSNAAWTGFSPTTDAVKFSTRPIYPPRPTAFLGVYPFVAPEGEELVLFGETDEAGNLLPGRTLTLGVHYQSNPDDGSIQLLGPVQAPLAPEQKLLFSYTRLRTLSPTVENEAVIYPRYRAKYSYITVPSDENGLLGTSLTAKYTYRSQDSFYYQSTMLTTYMGEVAQIAIKRVQQQNPSGGATTAYFPTTSNQSQGNFGLKAERRDLQDQDRAARTFIDFYNTAIVAFEQVLETLDGAIIGDRDGKFRFFVGRDKTYPPPGYEDGITGDLNPRPIWSQVFLAGNGSFGCGLQDIIVNPETATLGPYQVVQGDPMDPFVFKYYLDQQMPLVANDMDDQILAGVKRPILATAFPFPTFSILGDYRAMWEPHKYSRLFPETALAFTTTYPGLKADLAAGDPGVYSFFKILSPPKILGLKNDDTPVAGSTFFRAIGPVANPAMGVIEHITDAQARERLPRARIWAYYPEGSSDLDSALGTNTVGKATVVATPLYIKDFPIDPDTGLPDTSRFVSLGGDLADLNSGDSVLSTPGFQPYDDQGIFKKKVMQQIATGKPTGETFIIGNAQKVINKLFGSVDTASMYGGVFIGTVQAGCVLTLVDEKGNDLTGNDVLQLGEGELEGSPVSLEQGDTIYIVPPGGNDASEMSDPPTAEEQAEFTAGLPHYRLGFDMVIARRSGNFLDMSMPSIKDPMFPIKEMLGQKGPQPLTTIEADVEFVNNSRSPFEFPALRGEDTNDDGDHAIPYLGTRNTELDRLGEVAAAMASVTYLDGPAATPTQAWLAVYPDEIVGSDGQVLLAATTLPPATLLTSRDLTPVATAGFYTPNSGIGDTRAYDLLLIERPTPVGPPPSGIPIGSTGILTVGAVGTNQVEPPRFVSQTRRGDTIQYTLATAMSHFTSTLVSGVAVTCVPFGPNWLTTFDISTVGGLVFNDGAGPGVAGGLNNIFAGPNNAVIIFLIENASGGTPGQVLERIVLNASNCYGGAGVGAVVVAPAADEKTIAVITNAPFVTNTGTIFDLTVGIDTYITPITSGYTGGAMIVGSGSGSTTARIEDDRLTLSERVDLSTTTRRGTRTQLPGNVPVATSLFVWDVTASGVPGVTVNRNNETNASQTFTFLERVAGGPIGGFTPATISGAGDELGSIKVMAFEGHANTPISGSSITFSAVSSSEIGPFGVICDGTGSSPDDTCRLDVPNASVVTGSIALIETGDILVITASSIGDAAVKAGTYLIRHAVQEDNPPVTAGAKEMTLVGQAGPAGAWAEVIFPKVTTFNSGALTIDVDSTSGPGPGGTAWDAAGRLYVVPNSGDPTTVVSMLYTLVGNQFTLTTGSGLDAAGAFLSDTDFFAQVSVGVPVTGMRYIPVGTNYPSPMPPNNVVGFDNGVTTAGGYRDVVVCNPLMTGDGSTFNATFNYGGGTLVDSTGGAPGGGNLGVGVSTFASVSPAWVAFQSDQDAPVYPDVAYYIDLSGITSAQWDTIHAAGAATTTAVVAVLPTDRLVASSTVDADGNPTGTAGFVALAGIFVEPTFPRPTTNLNQAVSHVVDAAVTATSLSQVGMRSAASFGLASPELVAFQVRRIRRFHTVMDAVTANLTPLRYAYEIRRGVVQSYTASVPPFPGFTLVASTPTQLGDFKDPDVNINAGDVILLLDSAGEVVDQAEIAAIITGNTVLIRDPGFTQVVPAVGDSYQVFLRQPPVPHEQSNEQLFGLVVEETLLKTTPAYSTGDGGRVDTYNELKDTTVTDFRALGIQAGDYVVVDPAGMLQGLTGPASPVEYGMRPVGDLAVPDRGPGAPYIAGKPSELDDNRGFYLVTEVYSDHLVVTGASEFSGEVDADVVYGDAGQEYAVLPTIWASGNPNPSGSSTNEGQQDLRPTAPADPTNSFKGNDFSVEPFGYRVVRTSSLFSQEATELVFFIRERMFSWMEEMTVAVQGNKSGSYYVFQRDEHITDIGSPTDPDDGLGVVSNLFVTSLGGLVAVSPFANVSDCLSVLDRRYWVLDYRLDYQTPIGSATPYSSFDADAPGVPPLVAGSGRPVLPDRVEDVLDRGDRFRQMRYAWIKFRTDQVTGTLPSLIRYDAELPRRLEEQEDLLRMQEGLDET